MPKDPKDVEITAATAAALHAQWRAMEVLAIWTVSHGTADYGDRYVCRPHLVMRKGKYVALVHLIADDLATLRAQLPPGLFCQARQAADDPVIVEVWL